MTPTTKTKRYIVQNPRHIPEGRHILRWGQKYWYDGDDFEPPKGCDVARLLRDGLIKEVR